MGTSEGMAEMRRLAIFMVLGAGVTFAVVKMAQRGGPAMRARCSEMCERMLDQMPESFPPNRMMADLDALKEQTARILEVVERGTEN
ncbi:MAG: hypothetical protein ACC658_04970 [Acidimicrobiia bacterium]